MSYLQRLVDRAAGRQSRVHTRTDPVFPPFTARPSRSDGGDAARVAAALPSPRAPSAAAPPTVGGPSAPQGEAPVPAPAPRRDPAPAGPAQTGPWPPAARPAAPAASIESPDADPSAGGADEAKTSVEPAAARVVTVTVGRGDAKAAPSPGAEVVPARPAAITRVPREMVPQKMPSPGSAAIAAGRDATAREPERPAPGAPVDVHIDTIEIVAGGSPARDAAAPAAVTGFADYDAVRSYDWGD